MTQPYPTRSDRALFEPARASALRLANRIVMAPLTRDRAGPGLVPGPLAVEYYAQRASAGLIVAEATQVSAQAQGYANTPGCYTDGQVAGWRRVTDAVHAKGGAIVVQLWHTGRMSHTSFQRDGHAPRRSFRHPCSCQDLPGRRGFRHRLDASCPGPAGDPPASSRTSAMPPPGAIEAGFDGVELPGAHGYLLDAFLRDGTNHRTDAYGGSIANRARLILEVAGACAEEIGADRLGIRISPVSTAGDSHDSDPQPLFDHVVEGLSRLRLAYVHVVEGETEGAEGQAIAFDYAALRDRFDGTWMVNNGYDRQMAIDAVASGRADLVAFGRPFITNPDLVARLNEGAPLHESKDESLFYGGGAHGYTDYPTLGQSLLDVA